MEESAPANPTVPASGRPLGGPALAWVLLVLAAGGVYYLKSLPPNYFPGKAREAQVKQNLLIIQTALERYAVENAGYPLWLLGGHPTDPNTTPVSAVFNPFCPPYCGDGDALMLWGFVSQYPDNPILRYTHLSGMPWVRWSGAGDSPPPCLGSPTSRPIGGGAGGRRIGGTMGNIMWDVTEGSFACGPAGEPLGPYLSRGWNGHPPHPPLPPQDGSVNCTTQICRSRRGYQRPFMPGNFLYVPRFANGPGEPWGHWPALADGYYLAGYGAVTNPGLDTHNWAGDFGQGIHWCVGEGEVGACPDGGPDGERDGIILVLSSEGQ